MESHSKRENAGRSVACPNLSEPRHLGFHEEGYSKSLGIFGGVSAEARVISSKMRLKSSKPVAGMMMVSRRPLTSSVMRRKRPRGFSFKVKTKDFRSIWTLSVRMVSSTTGGLGEECCGCGLWPLCPYGEGRSLDIIRSIKR